MGYQPVVLVHAKGLLIDSNNAAFS
jgi:hypothetical protein